MRSLRVAAAAVLVTVLAGRLSAEVIDRVVAVVDGHLITLSDVRTVTALGLIEPATAIPADADREPIVERLIDRVLVLQEVDRYAPAPPDDKTVDARVAAIAEKNGSSARLDKKLESLGVSAAWLRHWLTDSLRIQTYVDQRFGNVVQPTDEEVEAFFREHASEYANKDVSAAPVQAAARADIVAARRRAVLTEWVTGLRRRAEILRPTGQGR
jgi:parvulin-like peptidyl-prolyl isomerase